MGRLEESIRTDGYLTPMTAAADGEVFDGSARLETVADVLAEAEPIVVESDGTRPIIHVRTDIPSADDPRARRLALAANRVAELNLEWDAEVLAELRDEGAADALFYPHELAALTGEAGEPVDPNELWRGMPEFKQDDKTAFQSIHVHFKSKADVEDFARLINQSITDRTRSLWYPYIEIERYADKGYTDES
jgi:hypothetical protein